MAGHIGDMVSQHWNTPEELLVPVRQTLGAIDLDPCDNEFSKTEARVSYKLPEHNGLTDSWLIAPDGSEINKVFCNPPYGTCYLMEGRNPITRKEYKALDKEAKQKVKVTKLEDWFKRACDYTFSHDEYEIIMLVPSSTETSFWFKYVWGVADAICFLKGRVAHPLEGEKVAASTKGSAMIYYGPFEGTFRDAFENYGKAIKL